MEGFEEEGDFMGTNDVVEEEDVRDDGHLYGFDAAPSPMDGSSGSPMQSPAVYGYGGSPLPFDEAAAADNDDIFTEASGGGPLLPDPGEMREEGNAFRDWRRQNAKYLEDKEKKEKELRNQIIAEAEEYKRKFFEKSTQNCETNKAQNREREKLYHTQQDKFHKEADQHFWKAVAEIIPREVANFEKRRSGRKEDDKKPSVHVIQGPKPGKPTDMTRMRQILSKLKTNPPAHMMPPPPPEKKDSNEGKDSKDGKPAVTPKASKDDKSDAAATPKAGGKPVSSAKDSTPKKGKQDEAAGTDGKEKGGKKETPVVVA